MKEQDYPVEHFHFMTDLAAALAELPAQILEHHYQYEAFGSWWFSLKFLGRKFRVLFDGKDAHLSLEEAIGSDWKEIASRKRLKTDAADMKRFVLEALKGA